MGSGVNLEKHGLALLAAKGDVVSGRAAASWALFSYEKSNELKLLDSGAGGPDELARRFQSGSVMYGLCRLADAGAGQQQVVLINWVGDKVSAQRQQACAGHLPAIRAFFKEANLAVEASRTEEVTQDGLRRLLSLTAPPGGAATKKVPLGDPQEVVGTNYKKTNPALEILRTKRDSFWAQVEREEAERCEEERQRAKEERRRWERQRMEEERREAAERELRGQEKERLIQEHRKQQAQLEAEERRREQARWEQQQREREQALAECDPWSGSTEKATEAAVLALQRSDNPRDFFHQRDRSGSASGTPEPPSPVRGRPGPPRRPFFHHQRSLTESAYIFGRPPAHTPSGDFLPAASPPCPPAAPLSKPPTPTTHPTHAPERKEPLLPTSPPLLDSFRTSPMAEAGFEVCPVGGLPPTPPSEMVPFILPETAAPHSNGHEAGPKSSSSESPLDPSPGSPPHTKSPPPATLPQPSSLRSPTAMGPAAQSELQGLQHAASPVSSAPRMEEALPHTDTTDPIFASSPDPEVPPAPRPISPEVGAECELFRGAQTDPLTQETDLTRDDSSAPVSSLAASAIYSGHNGTAALGEERWHGGQAAVSAQATVPNESAMGPSAGARAPHGNQATVEDHWGDGEDPSLPTGEVRAA